MAEESFELFYHRVIDVRSSDARFSRAIISPGYEIILMNLNYILLPDIDHRGKIFLAEVYRQRIDGTVDLEETVSLKAQDAPKLGVSLYVQTNLYRLDDRLLLINGYYIFI